MLQSERRKCFFFPLSLSLEFAFTCNLTAAFSRNSLLAPSGQRVRGDGWVWWDGVSVPSVIISWVSRLLIFISQSGLSIKSLKAQGFFTSPTHEAETLRLQIRAGQQLALSLQPPVAVRLAPERSREEKTDHVGQVHCLSQVGFWYEKNPKRSQFSLLSQRSAWIGSNRALGLLKNKTVF